MKLTRASVYALHALVHMAEYGENKPLASHAAAEARGIPERFLLKVLHPLVNARILTSVKGPHGGYRLAKPINKITILDIVEAVDGPIRGEVSFTEGTGAGADALDRKLQTISDRAAEEARRHFKAVTVADLAGKAKKK